MPSPRVKEASVEAAVDLAADLVVVGEAEEAVVVLAGVAAAAEEAEVVLVAVAAAEEDVVVLEVSDEDCKHSSLLII